MKTLANDDIRVEGAAGGVGAARGEDDVDGCDRRDETEIFCLISSAWSSESMTKEVIVSFFCALLSPF